MSLNPQCFPPIAPVPEGSHRPFWSVVIPAYNRPDYLTHCLQSVLTQAASPEDMQILVVDDCSPTSLESVVQQVGQGRVEYHRNAANLGNSGTYNEGIQRSRGQWIHVLHDDDWVLPTFYSTFQASLQTQPSLGAACCRFVNTDEVGNWHSQTQPIRPTAGVLENWLAQIAVCNLLSPPAVVIRREAYEKVGGYWREISYGEDWELYKRVAVFYPWWYQPETLACYRQHPDSLTHSGLKISQYNAQIHQTIALSETYLPEPVRAELTAASRRHYAIVSLNYAMNFLKLGEVALAGRSIQDALKLSREQQILHILFTRLLLQLEAAPLRERLAELLTNLDFES